MTETAARLFHLGDILSVTTGRLVSPRHVDGIYDLLGFMVGEPVWTHQLPRASDECEGPLLAQHPQLAAVVVPESFDGAEHRVRLAGRASPGLRRAVARHSAGPR